MYLPSFLKKFLSLFILFFTLFSFGQNDTVFKKQLADVDKEIDDRNYPRARQLLTELEKGKNDLRELQLYALDLRIAKIAYFADLDDSHIEKLLRNIEKLNEKEHSWLKYEYASFLAQAFKSAKNYKKAIQYYKLTLSNAEKRNDTLSVIYSCLKIGSCFYRTEYIDTPNFYKNNVDSARFYYRKGLNFPENQKNQKLFSRIYNDLCKIELHRKDTILALKYAHKSLHINRKISDSFGIAVALYNLGLISTEKREYKKSNVYLLDALDHIKNKSISLKQNITKSIALNFYELGDFEKAYNYTSKSELLSKQLAKRNLARKITKIEAKYNVAKAEQQTLQEKNKHLETQLLFYSAIFLIVLLIVLGVVSYMQYKSKQREKDITITNLRYKALGAQMNPHFINNLLSNIYHSITKKDSKTAIENLNKFSRLINLVLRATKSNFVYLDKELELLRLYIELQQVRLGNRFSYTIDTSSINDDLEDIQVPPMIIQPIVENAILHGLKDIDNGHLRIEFEIENDAYLICSVIDNNTSHINLSTIEKGNGISFKNIKSRLQVIDDIKAKKDYLNIANVIDKNISIGTKVDIQIPLLL